ncbi:MAG: hypothetical protein K8963_00085, partial [Proteobacteria bacterium]|nr:hypothetical protein [Pseudomonadota bacterium]
MQAKTKSPATLSARNSYTASNAHSPASEGYSPTSSTHNPTSGTHSPTSSDHAAYSNASLSASNVHTPASSANPPINNVNTLFEISFEPLLASSPPTTASYNTTNATSASSWFTLQPSPPTPIDDNTATPPSPSITIDTLFEIAFEPLLSTSAPTPAPGTPTPTSGTPTPTSGAPTPTPSAPMLTQTSATSWFTLQPSPPTPIDDYTATPPSPSITIDTLFEIAFEPLLSASVSTPTPGTPTPAPNAPTPAPGAPILTQTSATSWSLQPSPPTPIDDNTIAPPSPSTTIDTLFEIAFEPLLST